MIVVGADTPVGDAIISTVCRSAAEVRAFITRDADADSLKERGVKVALGDVSDSSHVEAAALYCFCAVLVTEAAYDDRDRAFAQHPDDVLAGWAEAARNAGVRRVIWVGTEHRKEPYPDSVGEVATVIVEGDLDGAAREVGELEETASLGWMTGR
ncbi:MAG: NAD(P)H-binding protein [bacterium]|nr:NAD(P)H-binding protein [bacterium]